MEEHSISEALVILIIRSKDSLFLRFGVLISVPTGELFIVETGSGSSAFFSTWKSYRLGRGARIASMQAGSTAGGGGRLHPEDDVTCTSQVSKFG
eukprot:CAMPEP_0198263970 /NCGR_PEP_ID=MMETSP1447-20131203/14213_1 /TAXON_ID=420782 /ORGANISM="Chaetoceros dichaeta, Strain CCMP1751" /LENGTH=94 /DNA_ID=CAMNT_0043952759 /DNA_START=341 /DNA_END=625 /DNA_ORIENTATION=-